MMKPIFNQNNQAEIAAFFLGLEAEGIQKVLLKRSKQVVPVGLPPLVCLQELYRWTTTALIRLSDQFGQ